MKDVVKIVKTMYSKDQLLYETITWFCKNANKKEIDNSTKESMIKLNKLLCQIMETTNLVVVSLLDTQPSVVVLIETDLPMSEDIFILKSAFKVDDVGYIRFEKLGGK